MEYCSGWLLLSTKDNYEIMSPSSKKPEKKLHSLLVIVSSHFVYAKL
uniref:Uncharacterized protein n=1 Tax=Anguilla anguilla TaxID=7936 RepID=A0A0E9UYN7_ANGAN